MDKVDVEVGAKILCRRQELGFSQGRVASALGITFQQLQKYEKGSNRVSASRLHALCAVLDVGPAYFFEGDTGDWAVEPVAEFLTKDRDCLRLNQAFHRIADLGLRRAIVTLVQKIAGEATDDATTRFATTRRSASRGRTSAPRVMQSADT